MSVTSLTLKINVHTLVMIVSLSRVCVWYHKSFPTWSLLPVTSTRKYFYHFITSVTVAENGCQHWHICSLDISDSLSLGSISCDPLLYVKTLLWQFPLYCLLLPLHPISIHSVVLIAGCCKKAIYSMQHLWKGKTVLSGRKKSVKNYHVTEL